MPFRVSETLLPSLLPLSASYLPIQERSRSNVPSGFTCSDQCEVSCVIFNCMFCFNTTIALTACSLILCFLEQVLRLAAGYKQKSHSFLFLYCLEHCLEYIWRANSKDIFNLMMFLFLLFGT